MVNCAWFKFYQLAAQAEFLRREAPLKGMDESILDAIWVITAPVIAKEWVDRFPREFISVLKHRKFSIIFLRTTNTNFVIVMTNGAVDITYVRESREIRFTMNGVPNSHIVGITYTFVDPWARVLTPETSPTTPRPPALAAAAGDIYEGAEEGWHPATEAELAAMPSSTWKDLDHEDDAFCPF